MGSKAPEPRSEDCSGCCSDEARGVENAEVKLEMQGEVRVVRLKELERDKIMMFAVFFAFVVSFFKYLLW